MLYLMNYNTHNMSAQKPTIGFVGQGFIGKNYANDFEARGYNVVRYALEPEYVANKENIKECDIVFTAVWTPTAPSGKSRDDGHPRVKFDDSIVRSAVELAGETAIVVIKSTIVPGTTQSIQAANPKKFILHSPEFLTEKTAAHDAAHPERNIVGMAKDTPEFRAAAEKVLSILPKAEFELITSAITAEHIKYANNAFLFLKIVFANIFYDLVEKNGADWESIRAAVGADPRVGPSHLGLHLDGDPANVMRRRGAGRSCFIKDFAALSEMYENAFPDDADAIMLMRGLEYKNSKFLRDADRYIDLLEGVYGEDAGKVNKKTI